MISFNITNLLEKNKLHILIIFSKFVKPIYIFVSNSSVQHFNVSERKILLRIIDIFVAIAGIFIFSEFHKLSYFDIQDSNIIWYVLLAFYILLFGTIFELYDLQKAESRFKIFKNLTLALLLVVLFFLLTPVYTPSLPSNRIEILYFFGILLISIYLWRIIYIVVITSPRFNRNTVIVGDNYNPVEVKKELEKHDPNFMVKGYLSADQKPIKGMDANCVALDYDALEDFVVNNSISEVIVTNSFKGVDDKLARILIPLLRKGYSIRSYSHVFEDLANKVPVQHVGNDFYCYFPFSRSHSNKLYQTFHRVMDIAVGLIGLIFLLLIIPFIFIVNLFFNNGPIFYKQTRVGKNGKHYLIYKLRTMVKDAEQKGAQWAVKNDVRITKFGKILRKTRLDEVPQFINVFKGDMSFIGPRPERPKFVDELKQQIPFYEIRHVIKPGVTGWAQVNAKYASSAEDTLEKLQFDLYYIKNRNVFLDLRIFLKTFSTVIFFRGQ